MAFPLYVNAVFHRCPSQSDIGGKCPAGRRSAGAAVHTIEILFNFIHPGQQFHGSGQIPGKAQYLTELDGVVKEHQPFIGHFRRLCFRGQMSLDLLQPGTGQEGIFHREDSAYTAARTGAEFHKIHIGDLFVLQVFQHPDNIFDAIRCQDGNA